LSQTPAASPQYSLTLDPNQEYTPAHYAAGIAVFENFLAKHPNSAHADYIHSQIVAWKSESDNVASGKVKFNNQWMTPEAKAPLVERLQKQMYVQAAQNTLASLKKKLSELQDHRDSLAEQVAAADGNLKSAHERLRTIPESLRDPIYKDYVYSNGATDRRIAGYTTVPNPERQAARDECDVYQQLVSSGPQKLANLDMKIRGIQIQIPRAEQDYANALAQVSPR
jgi:hypothetical protein